MQAMTLRNMLKSGRLSEFVEHELVVEPAKTATATATAAPDHTDYVLGMLWRNAFAFKTLLQEKNGLENSLQRMDMLGTGQELVNRLTGMCLSWLSTHHLLLPMLR
jgi:hypothetical protein